MSDDASKIEKKTSPPKAKKRLSDFEIFRTLLQRTTERKLPYLLKNIGEDSDIIFLCSENESEFVYGSSSISIAMIEILDESLKDIITPYFNKLYGLHTDVKHSLVINVRDQISDLSKTKGESFTSVVETNDAGSSWVTRKDIRGQERVVWLSKAIDSLFHFQVVREWCLKYRHLLTTDDPEYLYYPYTHVNKDTYSVLKLDPICGNNHPITSMYPNGFRITVSRGIDVLIDKGLEDLPNPSTSEELIIFRDNGAACHIVHRIIGEGWRMILLRPNSVLFPSLSTDIRNVGHLEL